MLHVLNSAETWQKKQNKNWSSDVFLCAVFMSFIVFYWDIVIKILLALHKIVFCWMQTVQN